MRVLAVDTSHPLGSAAVGRDGRVLSHGTFGAGASHLSEVGDALAGLLGEAGIAAGDLDRIAITSGPGSFTGLRVGMSYVKGLHAVTGVDIVVLTTLELLARQVASAAKWVCPMIDARRNEVYAALYRSSPAEGAPGAPVVPQQATEPSALLALLPGGPTEFIGTGAERYRELIRERRAEEASFVSGDRNLPSTVHLCQIAAQLEPLSKDAVLRLEPEYIRASDAKLKPISKR